MRHNFNCGARIKSRISCWSMNFILFIITIFFMFSLVRPLIRHYILTLAFFFCFFFIAICPTSKWYQLDGFHLHVVRDLTEKTTTLPPPIPTPASTSIAAEAPKPNGLVSTLSSLAISKSGPSSVSMQGFLDKAADEGLVIIQSPKVRI